MTDRRALLRLDLAGLSVADAAEVLQAIADLWPTSTVRNVPSGWGMYEVLVDGVRPVDR